MKRCLNFTWILSLNKTCNFTSSVIRLFKGQAMLPPHQVGARIMAQRHREYRIYMCIPASQYHPHPIPYTVVMYIRKRLGSASGRQSEQAIVHQFDVITVMSGYTTSARSPNLSSQGTCCNYKSSPDIRLSGCLGTDNMIIILHIKYDIAS